MIERAVINSQGPVLRIRDDLTINDAKNEAKSIKTLEETEREYIQKVLQIQNWRIDGPRGAAVVLGINPSTLRTRMAKLGINKPNGKHGIRAAFQWWILPIPATRRRSLISIADPSIQSSSSWEVTGQRIGTTAIYMGRRSHAASTYSN